MIIMTQEAFYMFYFRFRLIHNENKNALMHMQESKSNLPLACETTICCSAEAVSVLYENEVFLFEGREH